MTRDRSRVLAKTLFAIFVVFIVAEVLLEVAARQGPRSPTSSLLGDLGFTITFALFPIVGLILGTMVTFILEKKFRYAAVASAVGAVLSFIGLIHAPEVSWAANPRVALGYALFGEARVFGLGGRGCSRVDRRRRRDPRRRDGSPRRRLACARRGTCSQRTRRSR